MAPGARKKRAKAAPSSSSLTGRGAYFTGMTIRDVRCFGSEQSMTMLAPDGAPARWTVVLGENGVGKTTLLQMLALLSVEDSGEVEHRLDFELFELLDYPFRRRHPPRPGRLSASLLRKGEGGLATATFRQGRVDYKHTIEAGRREGSSRHPIKHPPFICGYGANRRLGEGGLSKRSREPRFAFLTLFADVELRDAEEWLLQADYAAQREKSARAERKRDLVKELLVRLLPDVSSVRIASPKDSDYPSVEAETPFGWVSVYSLSLGYQTLIAWMVDLASRFLDHYAGKKQPLAEPAVVLIDEIDLHLHPAWQRTLMTYLSETFPATQFIATAHSPLVVQGAAGANIVVLRRKGDEVLIENQPEEIRNWRIDQILTSDLYGLPSARPPHLDVALGARRAILSKAKLTAADEQKLRALEEEIGQLPGGESPGELRAIELIERAARELSTPTKRSKR